MSLIKKNNNTLKKGSFALNSNLSECAIYMNQNTWYLKGRNFGGSRFYLNLAVHSFS